MDREIGASGTPLVEFGIVLISESQLYFFTEFPENWRNTFKSNGQ